MTVESKYQTKFEYIAKLTRVHAVGRYAVSLQPFGQIFAVEDIGQLCLAVGLGRCPALLVGLIVKLSQLESTGVKP